jgi:AcrR family transcriptional regulator
MPSDTDLRGVVPARQRRSREAAERILSATEDLISERAFGDLTVQEICAAAEVSSSSFYARFPAKEDVLLALFDLHQREAKASTEASLADVAAAEGGRDEALAVLVGHFLRFARRNGPVMVSIFREPALIDRYYALSGEVNDRVVDYLCLLYGTDTRGFRRCAEFGTRVCAAAVQRAIGLPTRFGERMGLDDDEMVEELTRMMSGYLANLIADDPENR